MHEEIHWNDNGYSKTWVALYFTPFVCLITLTAQKTWWLTDLIIGKITDVNLDW